MTLSWQHSYMTYKHSKLGQTDLVFVFLSEFINRYVHGELCNDYDCDTLINSHAGRQLLTGYTISSPS